MIRDEYEGFDWDSGNQGKNWRKHHVSDAECEAVFFNEPFLVLPDAGDKEERYFALGRTNVGRRLFVVFTSRGKKIRVISARDMTKKERSFYPV